MNQLPEEWCVEATKDNWKILFKWANFNWNWHKGNKYVTCFKTHTDNLVNNDYTEISFDDFKRLVLGETINNEMIIEIW